ncbi:craniofacial development protein 2-like [Toxorhynchites rutilus septentrionalis]|uniref:craniofacial development protein 2-like n=1 Tax=Toxorhynchites rutilus septentrionalis TaxID=329112 RepID=UPI002479778E|nr:craniofacial development protein 2-like [Toxorhynchites rutilus septentrionalis]
MYRLRIKGRFFNISIINVHSPHLASPDDDKGEFYAQLEREYERCPKHDIKIIIGDFNAQIGKEQEFKPVIVMYSAHPLTNENGLRLIDFATSKNMAVRSTFFQHKFVHQYTWRSPNQTESQINHVLIDGRHFSNITDVRTYRGANISWEVIRPASSKVSLLLTKSSPYGRFSRNARYTSEELLSAHLWAVDVGQSPNILVLQTGFKPVTYGYSPPLYELSYRRIWDLDGQDPEHKVW